MIFVRINKTIVNFNGHVSNKNDEWLCKNSTSVVDTRSGVSGSSSKKAQTEQRRSVVTDYHIKLEGSPDYEMKHTTVVQFHAPNISAHLQEDGEEQKAEDSDGSEDPVPTLRVMTLVNVNPAATSRAMELLAKISANSKDTVDN